MYAVLFSTYSISEEQGHFLLCKHAMKVHICIDYEIVQNKGQGWLGVCSRKFQCFID